jgi:hypothetical protein
MIGRSLATLRCVVLSLECAKVINFLISEYCNHPIISISLGLPAVFLLGKGDRNEVCHEILLGHGDILIMDQSDREALHAVPRVLDLEMALKQNKEYLSLLQVEDKKSFNYLKQARLNINIRQVSYLPL